jgi:VIT1/CCC1 family predicted Fe2+/Mn2+ transporter
MLLHIIIVLVILGLLLYVVGLLPIDAQIKKIIQAIVIVVIVLWLVTLLLPVAWMPFR